MADDGLIITIEGIKTGVRIAVYVKQETVFGIKHKNTSTPMIPRRRAEGNKKGVSAVSEEARKQKLQNAAEIIDQMSEKETEIAKLVAQSMQLGYDLAKAETQPA